MNKLTPFLILLLILLSIKSQAQGNRSKAGADVNQPNVILIVIDDLGWKDLGFMGSKYYQTPNIDRLASESLTFSNGYAAAANCAPSRACLFSGQNTPRHGVYTVGTSERGRTESRKLIPTANLDMLDDSVFTLAELMKASGYQTATIGKWHIGKDPRSQGFDLNIAGNAKGNAPSYFPPYQNPDLADGPRGEYITDRLGDEAVNYLKNRESGKPFFLYLPNFAVHTPLQAPEDLKKKYVGKGVPGQKNSAYAAMVESMDLNIGKVLKAVQELGLENNTIVIFTSDNGGIRSVSDQAPLRAGKGSYYEGGIRVPFTVKWPGRIRAGSTSDVPVTNLDLFPTLADITGFDIRNRQLDGNSLLPIFNGRTIRPRALYWHFPIYLQAYDPAQDQGRDPVFRTRPGAVIRQGKWKLHVYYEDNVRELYDLSTDLGERNNLANEQREITKRLYDKLLKWQKETKAPIPTMLNPAFVPGQQFVTEK